MQTTRFADLTHLRLLASPMSRSRRFAYHAHIFPVFFLVTPLNTALRENEMARIPVSRSLQALWKTPLRNSSPMIAKIMIINSTSKAICSSGAIAFRIDLSTTWRPATNIRSHTVKLGDSDGNFQKKHSVATTACQARVTAGCVHLCKMAGNTVIPFPYGKWHLVAAKKTLKNIFP